MYVEWLKFCHTRFYIVHDFCMSVIYSDLGKGPLWKSEVILSQTWKFLQILLWYMKDLRSSPLFIVHFFTGICLRFQKQSEKCKCALHAKWWWTYTNEQVSQDCVPALKHCELRTAWLGEIWLVCGVGCLGMKGLRWVSWKSLWVGLREEVWRGNQQ